MKPKKYNPAAAFQNAMLGTRQTAKTIRAVRKNPYADRDKDFIPAILDCNDYNKNKDTWWNPITWFKPAPTPPPAPSQPSAPSQFTPSAPTQSKAPGLGAIPTGTTTIGGTTYQTYTEGGKSYLGSEVSKVSGGGGSYNPSTGVYTSSTGVQQSMAQAPVGAVIEKIPEQIQAEKLQLGSVVTAYKPVTQTAEVKKLEAESKWEKAKRYISEKSESFGKAAGYITAPRDVIIDVFTGQKQKEQYVPTPEELMKKKQEESKSYYTRPTYAGGKLNFAGDIYSTPLTAGERLTTETIKEDIYANQQAENTARNIVNTWTPAAQGELNFDVGKIQEQYDSGKITYEETVDKSKKAQDRINQKYSNIINKELTPELKKIEDLSTERRNELVKAYSSAVALSLGQKFISGGLSVASWSIPVLGTAFKAADITGMVVSAPDLASSLYEKPLQTIGETAPYIAGGITAAGITGGIKTSITNSRLKADALAKQRNIKTSVSNSISVGNAVKTGVNADGSINWNVKVNVASKIINKNTGKVLDKVSSVSYVRAVTSPSGKGAVKSVVDAVSLELKRGGIRNYKVGNKVTIKLGLGVTKGEVYMQPTLAEDIFSGYGKFDTRTGTLKARATGKTLSIYGETPASASLKIRMSKLKKQSALSNILSKKIAGYEEIKIIKQKPVSIKVKGTEEVFQSGIATDIYKNLIDVKGYKYSKVKLGTPTIYQQIKVKPYARKPKAETRFRDYTKAYLKSFVLEEPPKRLPGTGAFIKPTSKLQLKQLKQSQAAQISAQAAATARANAVVQSLIGGIKTKAGKFTPVKYNITPVIKEGITGGFAKSSYYGKGQYERTAGGLYPQQLMQNLNQVLGVSQVRVQQPQIQVKQQELQIQKQLYINQLLGLNLGQVAIQEPQIQIKQIQKQLHIQAQVKMLKINQQQIQQQQQKQMSKLVNVFSLNMPQVPAITTKPYRPKIEVPIYWEYKKPRKEPSQKAKQSSYEKQMKKQARAYQASVAAFSLGIFAPRKKLPKRLTGFEIRPIEETKYAKQLNKMFA